MVAIEEMKLQDRVGVVLAAEPLTSLSGWHADGDQICYVGTVVVNFSREECERNGYLSNNPGVLAAIVEMDRGES